MYSLFRYQPSVANGRLAARSPWAAFDQDLNAFFNSAFDFASDTKRSIPVAVREDNDSLIVTAELPGVARDDLNIEYIDDVLSLNATRKVVGNDGEVTISYSRSFSLPYPVQTEKITAELKDGILTLVLPKAEDAKPHRIQIK